MINKTTYKSVLSFIAFIVTTSIISGQVPFAPIGAEWTYRMWWAPSFDKKYFNIKINRDTTIQGRYCTILEGYIDNEKVEGSDVIIHDENGKISFFENDVFYPLFDFSEDVYEGQLIEYYLPSNSYLYDYGAREVSPGEVINPLYSIENPYHLFVTNIDTIIVSNGDSLRQFYYDIYYDNTVGCPNYLPTAIERIGGSLYSIFRRHCAFLTAGVPSIFICYQDDQFTYSNISEECIITESGDLQPSYTLVLYPNPFSDNIYIRGEYNYTGIKVFDSRGNVIINAINIDSVDLSYFPNGVYYVLLTTKTSTHLNQIIKITH